MLHIAELSTQAKRYLVHGTVHLYLEPARPHSNYNLKELSVIHPATSLQQSRDPFDDLNRRLGLTSVFPSPKRRPPSPRQPQCRDAAYNNEQ